MLQQIVYCYNNRSSFLKSDEFVSRNSVTIFCYNHKLLRWWCDTDVKHYKTNYILLLITDNTTE